MRNEKSWYNLQSVLSTACKLSCRRTALKRCTNIEILIIIIIIIIIIIVLTSWFWWCSSVDVDQMVMSSIPGSLSGNISWQVFHTHVPKYTKFSSNFQILIYKNIEGRPFHIMVSISKTGSFFAAAF